MNQYMNYRKWRLSQLNVRPLTTYPEGSSNPSRFYSTSENKEFPDRSYVDPLTRKIIDDNPDSGTSIVSTSAADHQSLLRINDGISRVLSNLKYVAAPISLFHRPTIGISHTDNPPYSGEDSGTFNFDKGISALSSYHTVRSEEDIRRALANYAGAIFHKVFHGYSENPNPYSVSEHSNKYLPAIDEMEDSGIHYTLDDIPTDSPFHYANIQRYIPGQVDNLPILERHDHRKSPYGSPTTHRMEDLSFVLGHHGARLYKDYLDSRTEDSFEQYLIDMLEPSESGKNLENKEVDPGNEYNGVVKRRNRGKPPPGGNKQNISIENKLHPKSMSKKDRLIHEAILQLVQGLHLSKE